MKKAVKYEVWTHDFLDEEFITYKEVKRYFNEAYYGYGEIKELTPESDKDLIDKGFKWEVLWYKGSEEYPDGNYCMEDFSLIKPIYTCDEPIEEDPDVLAERLYSYPD